MNHRKWAAVPASGRSTGRATPMRRLIAGILAGAAVAAGLLAAGCNTVSGMGKDIKAAGEAIEKSAR